MRKGFIIPLLCLATLGLVACSNNSQSSADSTKSSSSTNSSSSKKSTKKSSASQSSTGSQQDSSSNQSSDSSSVDSTNSMTKIINRNARFEVERRNLDKDAFEKVLDDDIGAGETDKLIWYNHYDSSDDFKYTIRDLNNDGKDELLLGDSNGIVVIYSIQLHGPELLTASFASSHPNRQIAVLEDGTIIEMNWSDGNQEGTANSNKIGESGTLKNAFENKKFTVGDPESARSALGLTSPFLDASKLDWHDFDKKLDTNNQMDTDALDKGDYSSVAGTWQNDRGAILKFDKKGLVSKKESVSNPEIETDPLRSGDGKPPVKATYTDASGETRRLLFFPVGSTAKPTIVSRSDLNLDRIAFSNLNIDPDEYYYRVKD